MVYHVILILVIVAMGLWVWYLQKEKKENGREAVLVEKERDEYADLGKGLFEYNQKLQEKKNLAKDKILELFKTKEKISNREVARALNIGKTSTVRYLD